MRNVDLSNLAHYDLLDVHNIKALDSTGYLLSHKKTKELLIIKANALLYLEKGNEINEVLDEILKIDPDNMTALFHKSHHLEKNRQHREALKYNERILKKYPYDIIALLSKGRNLVELNEFDEAEVCYNIILEIDPKNKAAINLKSTLFKKKNNWTITAHDLMFKAIENFEREHFSTSETYFKQAIEMNPNFDEIWFAQGELFIRTGKINKAIESFEKALAYENTMQRENKHYEIDCPQCSPFLPQELEIIDMISESECLDWLLKHEKDNK